MMMCVNFFNNNILKLVLNSIEISYEFIIRLIKIIISICVIIMDN